MDRDKDGRISEAEFYATMHLARLAVRIVALLASSLSTISVHHSQQAHIELFYSFLYLLVCVSLSLCSQLGGMDPPFALPPPMADFIRDYKVSHNMWWC